MRRLMTELQMLLHEHPVNEARAARGVPTVNAVWLWGGGEGQRAAKPNSRRLASDATIILRRACVTAAKAGAAAIASMDCAADRRAARSSEWLSCSTRRAHAELETHGLPLVGCGTEARSLSATRSRDRRMACQRRSVVSCRRFWRRASLDRANGHEHERSIRRRATATIVACRRNCIRCCGACTRRAACVTPDELQLALDRLIPVRQLGGIDAAVELLCRHHARAVASSSWATSMPTARPARRSSCAAAATWICARRIPRAESLRVRLRAHTGDREARASSGINPR